MAYDYGHDSRAVANKVLESARQQGINLTIMQLLKLIYFAHGWCLAQCDRPLTKDGAEAWQYGPVYPLVYRNAPRAGVHVMGGFADPITKLPFADEFSPEETAIIDTVVGGYGRMHAFQLSDLTHQQGSPWQKAYSELGAYSEIPNEWISQYFKAQKA